MLQGAVELAAERSDPALQPTIERARRLLNVPPEVTTDLAHWSKDPDLYLLTRREAYRLLDTLRNVLGNQIVDNFIDSCAANRQRWLQEQFEARVAKFTRN